MPFITGLAQSLTKGKQAQQQTEAQRQRMAYESLLRRGERGIPQAIAPEQAQYLTARTAAEETGRRQSEAELATQQQEQLQAQQLGLLPPSKELIEKYKPVINIAKGLPKERQEKIRQLFQARLGGTEQEVAIQRVRNMIAKKISDLGNRGLTVSYVNGRLRIQPKKETTGINLDAEMDALLDLSNNTQEAETELQFLINSGMLNNAQAAELWDKKFK